jgi:CRP-like cAMP-binding protein
MTQLSVSHLSILRSARFLRGLDERSLIGIAGMAQRRDLGNEAYYFMQGDAAREVYVLLEGKVKLGQVTEDGQQVILEFIGPGREFGLVTVAGELDYPVTAQAAGDCVALTWSREVMFQILDKYPLVSRNALAIMAHQIGYFQTRIRELSTQRVERRIARTLLRLAQRTGKRLEQGVLIDLPLSRQNLAEMAGTTLFTVSRIMKQWENQGLIQSKREQVIILFPHGLVRIAEDLLMDE